MYKIIKKVELSSDTILFQVIAPRIAQNALPGQFLIVKIDEKGERIPLTISDIDKNNGSIVIVFKAIGNSTRQMAKLEVGNSFLDVVGPLGRPSELVNIPADTLKNYKVIFIGGGVGIAPVFPQVKWLHEHGNNCDVIIGAKTKSLLIYENELRKFSDNLYVVTEDGSSEHQGLVTDMLKSLVNSGKHYDEVVAIGPLIMMKFVAKLCAELKLKCTVSLNALMVDGTGMCGACRVSIGAQTKFTCVDGPEFDAALVNFDEAMRRQAMYNNVEGHKLLEEQEIAEGHSCHIGGVVDEPFEITKRVPVREQDAKLRATNFNEVCLGYNAEEAVREALRCRQCKNPMCVSQCPVAVNIPAFIHQVAIGKFEEAARLINKDTALPAVCGRVCPQEIQCENKCILGIKGEPIAIGKLERFVGDWARENNVDFDHKIDKNHKKVAVVGSGPAGLTCAKELLMLGYDLTIFEALHEYGGVLVYGIPAFRLPKDTVVRHEIDNLRRLGAKFEKNVIIGRSVSIDELIENEHYEAIFVGTGAGLPNFLNIPGENLCGVVSANEFLTRNNLLFAYKSGYETPNFVGKKVVVVGGGNVAMDAARTALRLGANVTIVYRRSEDELPARKEEVHHAKEEGVNFELLCNPIEVLANDNAWVNAIKCIRMQLGEPDKSGRRRPVEIAGSEFVMPADMLIVAVGTSPNPLIATTTPGLETNKSKCLVVNENGATTRDGVFAGGDAVSGAATVILAMGAGKKAAKAIHNYLNNKL